MEREPLNGSTAILKLPMLAVRREQAAGGSASISFAIVSQQAWGSGEWSQLPSMPTAHFSNYSPDQLVACLLKVSHILSSDDAMGVQFRGKSGKCLPSNPIAC